MNGGLPSASLSSLLKASEAAAREGRHADGVLLAAQAVERARAHGARDTLAEALSQLALHQLRVGSLEPCLLAGQEALGLLQGSRHGASRARLLCTIALACRLAGLFDQALQHGGEALRLAEAAGDEGARAWALNRLGCAHVDLGELQQGDRLLRESLALGERLGDTELQFAALNNLASRFSARAGETPGGETPRDGLAQALELLQRASALARQSGNAHRQGLILVNLAEAQRVGGQTADAMSAALAAQALARAHGLQGLQLYAQIEQALAHLAAGQVDCALQQLQALRPQLPESEHDCLLDYWRGMVEAQRRLGRHEEALASYAEFHALALTRERMRSRLNAQLLIYQHDMEQLRVQAQRARLDAEMQRLRVEQLRREAYEDALTGLYNRRFVMSQLELLRERAQRQALPLWAAIIDADHFKAVNDCHGHRVGDAVLRELGRLIQENTRVSDLAARMGGEEFLLLMPDTSLPAAQEVCERLRRHVEAHDWARLAPGLRLSVSIGLAPVGAGEDQALDAADAALYGAKAAGRNRVTVA